MAVIRTENRWTVGQINAHINTSLGLDTKQYVNFYKFQFIGNVNFQMCGAVQTGLNDSSHPYKHFFTLFTGVKVHESHDDQVPRWLMDMIRVTFAMQLKKDQFLMANLNGEKS